MSIDEETLLDGVHVGGDLLIKASLRVPDRPMRYAVSQSLADDLKSLYQSRLAALEADIISVLDGDDVTQKSDVAMMFANGRLLFKAMSAPKPPNTPKEAKAPSYQKATQPKTVTATGDRKLTPSGYVHVESPGSRGGRFWRDDKGNVRYGERPHGNFTQPATPDNVVEHYRQYYAPQPFAAHDQMDVRDALMNSDALTEADHGFMEWWNDNYDAVLESFGITRKDVERAGGLHNISVKIGGRDVAFSEAMEEFFRANADLFVGDPQYGDIESPDDILEAVRGLMSRYQKALHEDPKVQAAARASAEKHENNKNAFYIRAEQMADDYSPLAADVITSQDPNDAAVRMTVAMAQLGLVRRGTKGGVAQRRMRGAIVPESGLLMTRKRDLGSLWREGQLERLNASQLMALYVATDAQSSFSSDNTYDFVPDDVNEMRDGVLKLIAAKIGIAEDDVVGLETLRRTMVRTSEATLKAFTAYNTGQDPHFADVLGMKVQDVAGKSDIMDEHMKKVAEEQARLEKILAAQEDDSFEPPATMKNGVWNGKTLKDPNDPSKGVWGPFRYQKKYINWMIAAKRGVIAADAGMGKTPVVIAFRETLAQQGRDIPAICFLPPSLMEQWPAAIAKFAPDSADSILNLSGLSLEERKVALQSDMAKKAKYIFISTGTLTGDVPDPNATEDENDGTGGSDQEMVKILQGLEGAVFIDEAHQGGYKKAGNTRHEIAKSVMQDREYAFGMTATPMPNDPMDVYHLANLFAPGSVGDQELWTGRMAGVAWNEEKGAYDVSNPEHLAELNKRLRPFVFYKSINDPDVVADMGSGLTERRGVHESQEMWPDEGDLSLSKHVNAENGLSQHDYFKENGVIDTMVTLRVQRLIRDRNEKVDRGEVNPATGEPYEPYAEKMIALMAGGMQMMLQRQASISPALIDPTYRKADGGVAHTPKMKALCDDIIAHFSNGGQGGNDAKPLVTFCSFPQKAYPIVRKALAERGVDPSLVETIAGDVLPQERGYIQDKVNKGHAKVLLVGTMSGGAGLNLQEAANKTLFLDEPWNPAAKRQAIGRVWRTGQLNPVHEKTYRSVDTFDMAVEQKIAGKQAMVGALLGKQLPTEETFDAEGSVQELLGRVKGASFNEAQIRAIMENSQRYDLASNEQKQAEKLMREHWGDDSWKEMAASGGHGGVGATLTDKDFEPNKKAQQTLRGKGAGVLTKPFDEKDFRAKWEMNRDKRRSKQNFQMAELMEDVHRSNGDTERAEQYKRRADDLKARFPDLQSSRPQKRGDKKSAAKKPEKASSKEPAKGAAQTVKPAEKPSRATATVADAQRAVDKKTSSAKPEDGAPVVPKAQGSTPAKVTSNNLKLGLAFHTKENPFKEGSGRKLKGSDVSQAEAHIFFDLLSQSKHKDWSAFITKEVKPLWDDEDGRNPFSMDKAEDYMQKVVEALQGQGLVTQSEAHVSAPVPVMKTEQRGTSKVEPKKVETKKTESKKAEPVNTGDPKAFASAVQQTVDSLPASAGHGEEKVYISEVYHAMKDRLGGMPLDQFKTKLTESLRGGGVILSRADTAFPWGAKQRAESEISNKHGTLHFAHRSPDKRVSMDEAQAALQAAQAKHAKESKGK